MAHTPRLFSTLTLAGFSALGLFGLVAAMAFHEPKSMLILPVVIMGFIMTMGMVDFPSPRPLIAWAILPDMEARLTALRADLATFACDHVLTSMSIPEGEIGMVRVAYVHTPHPALSIHIMRPAPYDHVRHAVDTIAPPVSVIAPHLATLWAPQRHLVLTALKSGPWHARMQQPSAHERLAAHKRRATAD